MNLTGVIAPKELKIKIYIVEAAVWPRDYRVLSALTTETLEASTSATGTSGRNLQYS